MIFGAPLLEAAPLLQLPDLVGTSAPMRELRGEIGRAIKVPFSVLIEGETGTGKDIVATLIHDLGAQRGARTSR